MTIMIIGLLIFLGSHSVRIFAENWRQQQIAKHGETTWKVAYSAVSIVGLAIAIYGFGQMRLDPIYIWYPPMGMRHAVALLMVPAFIMLVAAYIPHNAIKAKLGHPMMLAVKMITAIPGMPLLIKLATPEKMVSSSRIPLENKIEIGYTLAGNKKILAVIKHAHVFCSLRMTRR